MHLGDTIFIFCLALIIFGPKKLPEIGRQIGKLMVEFRRASNEFKMQIEEELRVAEQADRQKEITAAASPAKVMTPAPGTAIAAPAAADEPAATESAVPTIAPPVTGLPVNHTFASESAVESAEAVPDAYPEPANGFNEGLNTASNGVSPETSPSDVLESEILPVPESTQAATHHG